MPKEVNAAMDNCYASTLGKIASAAGDAGRSDIGDSIDRGLVLLRLLNEAGFALIINRS